MCGVVGTSGLALTFGRVAMCGAVGMSGRVVTFGAGAMSGRDHISGQEPQSAPMFGYRKNDLHQQL